MTEAKQKVKDLCDDLMKVKPSQIIIDLVQDDIEEALADEDVTPDDINALSYQCDILLQVYNPELDDDILYLEALGEALSKWGEDAEFANRSLGIDPNK